MSVTVTITGGPSATVPFSNGMNAQNALEAMWNQIHTSSTFSFALEYYGSTLGYLVLMIDNVYDTPTAPYSYWEFFYNGQPSSVGIDNVTLNDGDQIAFSYESAAEAATPWKHAKHARRSSSAQ